MAVALSGLLIALNLSKEDRGRQDDWLAGWFGLYCAMSLSFLMALHMPGLLGALTVVLATSLIILAGPFLYFYAKSATGESIPRFSLHFVPFALSLLSSLGLLFGGQASRVGVALVINLNSSLGFLIFLPPLVLVASLAYPWFSYKALQRWRETLKDELSALERADLAWVRVWIVSSVVLTFALLLSGLATNSGLVSLSLYIGFCLAAFCLQLGYVGYFGLSQASVFGLGLGSGAAKSRTPSGATEKAFEGAADVAALEAFMGETHPHLTAGLTIDALSDQIGWDPLRLSEVIRQGFGVSYFDFINARRVEEVKALMADPRNQRITLLSLAMDAGFGSKSAFNEAFKRHVGQSPSQYRRGLTTS